MVTKTLEKENESGRKKKKVEERKRKWKREKESGREKMNESKNFLMKENGRKRLQMTTYDCHFLPHFTSLSLSFSLSLSLSYKFPRKVEE